MDPMEDFINSWENSKYLYGEDPLSKAIKLSKKCNHIPKRNRKNLYKNYNNFISVAAHLQVLQGNECILLPSEQLAEHFNIRKTNFTVYHKKAIKDGYLKKVKQHNYERKHATLFKLNLDMVPEMVEWHENN